MPLLSGLLLQTEIETQHSQNHTLKLQLYIHVLHVCTCTCTCTCIYVHTHTTDLSCLPLFLRLSPCGWRRLAGILGGRYQTAADRRMPNSQPRRRVKTTRTKALPACTSYCYLNLSYHFILLSYPLNPVPYLDRCLGGYVGLPNPNIRPRYTIYTTVLHT